MQGNAVTGVTARGVAGAIGKRSAAFSAYFRRPSGTRLNFSLYPALKRRATVRRPSGAVLGFATEWLKGVLRPHVHFECSALALRLGLNHGRHLSLYPALKRRATVRRPSGAVLERATEWLKGTTFGCTSVPNARPWPCALDWAMGGISGVHPGARRVLGFTRR